MEKDFDKWNKLKKDLQKEERKFFAHPREIWWSSLGINIGAEIDGKNENFERPIIILKVYSRESMLILPITSKEKNDKFHFKIEVENPNESEKHNRPTWVKLTQSRVISNKRLLRKIGLVSQEEFIKLKKAFDHSL